MREAREVFYVLRQLACLLRALPLSSSPGQQVTRGTKDSIAQGLLAVFMGNWNNLKPEVAIGIAYPQFMKMVIQLLSDGRFSVSHGFCQANIQRFKVATIERTYLFISHQIKASIPELIACCIFVNLHRLFLALFSPCGHVWYMLHDFVSIGYIFRLKGFWMQVNTARIKSMVHQIIRKLRDKGFQLLIVHSIHLLYQQLGSASEMGISLLTHVLPSFHTIGVV